MNTTAKKWFDGRRLLIATKHGKEKVIAPVLEKALGVTCIVPEDYDTDQFGTFTGEIERNEAPLETARRKCETAMSNYGYDLAIASEGSFGAHPLAGFLPCNDELLMLIDKRNRLEICERELSMQTNMNAASITTETELTEFAVRCGFPGHGIVLSLPGTEMITKGINDAHELIRTFRHYKTMSAEVKIETDMRAMLNPTRMKVIEKATVKLAGRINSLCPECHFPGFGITDALPGLPCEMCNRPTRSTLAYRYTCVKCRHSLQLPKSAKKKEDAAFCDYCNP